MFEMARCRRALPSFDEIEVQKPPSNNCTLHYHRPWQSSRPKKLLQIETKSFILRLSFFQKAVGDFFKFQIDKGWEV